jgi:hypothetical protein
MSSKAKGKQRAVDGDDGVDDGPGGMEFSVRFTDGHTEDLLDMFVNDSDTVREVKRRVRSP